jgi:hypothetical protein
MNDGIYIRSRVDAWDKQQSTNIITLVPELAVVFSCRFIRFCSQQPRASTLNVESDQSEPIRLDRL